MMAGMGLFCLGPLLYCLSILPGSSSSSSSFALQLNNGLGSKPPMGWNSWNHFGCGISEEIIHETVDALISSGLATAGYEYVNIDDCWASYSRDSEGYLVPDNKAFPSGIKALADYVHSKGLKLGIYSDAGILTCERRPGSLFYEDRDAETFANWGVDYLKYDNCYNLALPPKWRYPRMRDALNKTGRPIFFSMCEWGEDDPATWANAVGNSWRTTEDITDTWESMTKIADLNDQWATYAGPSGWNDPDMLEVGNGGMTFVEYRAHFSIWALMKAPLLVGCDIRNLSIETHNILSNTEVIAISQDSLGIQGKKVNKQGLGKCLEVWAGPLYGNSIAVALWNRCNETDIITASWEDIGLQNGTYVRARDLWKHEDLPNLYSGNMSWEVEPHDLKMFTLKPTKFEPIQPYSTSTIMSQIYEKVLFHY